MESPSVSRLALIAPAIAFPLWMISSSRTREDSTRFQIREVSRILENPLHFPIGASEGGRVLFP